MTDEPKVSKYISKDYDKINLTVPNADTMEAMEELDNDVGQIFADSLKVFFTEWMED